MRALVSIVALTSLLLTQLLPVYAQTIPSPPVITHHEMSPNTMPNHLWWNEHHQWTGTGNSTGSNGSTWHHPGTYHMGTTSSTNTGQSGTHTPGHHHWQDEIPPQTLLGVNSNHFWSAVLSGSNTTSSTNHGTMSGGNALSQHTSAWQSHQVDLNLASTSDTTTGGRFLGNRTIDITVGSSQLAVTSSTSLTEAEKLAVIQVLTTGQQSLAIDSQGSADGGTLTIGSRLSAHLADLVIPQGVTVTDISHSGTLNVTGALTDNGTLYVTTTNPALANFSILASTITIGPGGLITTMLPTGSPLATTAPANLGLSLTATNSITNAGSITTAGALNLSAGGDITNALPQGASGSMPTIQAAGDVNLSAGTGNLTNGGLISSTNGNINITTPNATTDINVNAEGGTFQALVGDINVRDASYAGSANTNLAGGNFLSQNLNLNGGTGTVSLNAGEVTGTVNAYAGSAHIGADTPDLKLGAFQVSGDPFVWNNGGNLDLYGIISGGPIPYLVATASGSIYTSGSAGITTNPTGANTSNVVLVAGVIAQDSSLIPPTSGSSSSGTGSITLTRSGTGGDIYLVSGGTIDGTATQDLTGISANGGSITLIAFAASPGSNTGGHIFLPTNVEINTINNGNGGTGGITIIGEAAAGSSNTISTGPINTAMMSTNMVGAVNVDIQVATPNLSGVSISDSTGAISGSFDTGNLALQNGGIAIAANASGYSIVTGGGPPNISTVNDGSIGSTTIKTAGAVNVDGIINTSGLGGAGGLYTFSPVGLPGGYGANAGNITILAGGSVNTGSLLAFGGGGGGGASSSGGLYSSGGSGGDGGQGASIDVNSTSGSVTILGDVNNSGGGGGGDGTSGTAPSSPPVFAAGGPAGRSLTISALGTVTIQGTVLSVTGGMGGGIVGSYGGGGSFGGGGGGGGGSGGFGGSGGGGYFGGGGGGNGGASGGGYNGGGAGGSGGLDNSGAAYTGGYGEIGVAHFGESGTGFGGGSNAGFGDVQVGTGGTVTLTGNTVAVNGTVTQASSGDTTYNGASIIAAGENDNGSSPDYDFMPSITITTYGGAVTSAYQSNANYSSGAATQPIAINSTNSFTSTGFLTTLYGNLITISGFDASAYNAGPYSGAAAAGSYAGLPAVRIAEGSNIITVSNGNPVTPAEQIAVIQAAAGQQSLLLSQPSSSSSSGTGFASGGSFTVSSDNIPSGGFSNLILPSGVTENITAASVTYTGSATVNGTINDSVSGGLLQFTPAASGQPLSVTVDGAISLTGGLSVIGFNTGAYLMSDINGTGSLVAGEINVGDLNPATLGFLTPFITVTPFLGSFSLGNISISQDSINGLLQISSGPPTPATQAIATTTQSDSKTTSTLQLDEINRLDEQIGTRIATDYTPVRSPYTAVPVPYVPGQPLHGLVAVEQLASAPGQALFAASAFNANELNALAQKGIVFGAGSKPNFLDLIKGYVFFMPQTAISVQTREGTVYIPKGAAVWIMETGADSAIYDFEASRQPVKVVANNKPLTISPGTQVLLTRDAREDFAKLNPGGSIAYRNVRRGDVGTGITAYIADFSIAHAMTNVEVIRSLLHSKDPLQMKMAHQMLKNATILADLTGMDYKTAKH